MPPEIFLELVRRIDGSYKAIGIEAIRAEGVIIAVKNPLDERLALKVIRPEYNFNFIPNMPSAFNDAQKDQYQRMSLALLKFKKRFEEGTRIQQRICNEINRYKIDDFAVPQIKKYSESPTLYAEMEWVYGVSVLRRIKEKNDIRYSFEKYMTLLDCVQFLHEHEFIHRDIKADNIMIGGELERNEKLYLLDWTLSKGIGRQLTVVGEGLGTPGYASPEQYAKKEAVNADQRDDIYSLGVSLWEFWFNTAIPRLPDEAYEDENRNAEYLAGLVEQLPKELQPIFKRATEPRKMLRYANIAQLKTDLIAVAEKVLNHAPSEHFVSEKLCNDIQKKVEACTVLQDVEFPDAVVDTDVSIDLDNLKQYLKNERNEKAVRAIIDALIESNVNVFTEKDNLNE